MHSSSDPSHVRFTGPLAPFAPELVSALRLLGYTRTSATIKLGATAHLSRWLSAQGLDLSDLTDEVLRQFVVARRGEYTSHRSARSFAPIVEYLRRVGAMPPASPPQPPTRPGDVLLARFHDFLVHQRSLSTPVADAYCHWVHPFVAHVSGNEGIDHVSVLTAGDVTQFLTGYLPALSRKQAQMTACGLRAFLRFAYVRGIVSADLATAIPSFPLRRLSRVPDGLTMRQVDALFDACDRSTSVGRRDFAVITCFVRLGLRRAEAASLHLDDVDWAAGTVTVHGKGNRIDQLPLPVDVGEAIVAYLRDGRPATTDRAVFVRAVAPFTALGPSSISCIVGRVARRAGLGTIHAHRLRHTTATLTLNAGASLDEVAQLMRHASVNTTATYAKTDLTRLAGLTRPWPAIAGVS